MGRGKEISRGFREGVIEEGEESMGASAAAEGGIVDCCWRGSMGGEG